MATFNLSSVGDISLVTDWGKLQSYLYQLRKQLQYMFDNLNPEDNYSSEAYEKYLADGDKASKIEQSVDHISLEMITKDNVVSAINLSEEGVKIHGDKISMEGVVTVNSYFKIGLDGSIEAVNGKFSGNISASTMTSSAINSSAITLGGSGNTGKLTVLNASGTVIGSWDNTGISVKAGSLDIKRGSNIGLYCNGNVFRFGDFEVNDAYDRQILQSSDDVTGMSGDPGVGGAYLLWAGWDGSESTFAVNNEGRVQIWGDLWVNQTNIMDEIADLWDAIDDLDNGGGGGSGGSGGDIGGYEDIPPGSLS